MLKNIPAILSPDFLKILMEMGHGDEIVIADGNFPAASIAKRLVRCDGHSVPDILDVVLKLLPLDSYSKKPVTLMEVVKGDDVKTPIWEVYRDILQKHEPGNCAIEHIERFDFYERSKSAFAIASTGERALYANIILKKGVVV